MRNGAVMQPVPFGRDAPRCEPGRPGGDEERPAGARERLAERLDGAAIRIGGGLEAAREGEVVPEREVDHAIRRGGRAPQGIEIVNGAAQHLGPCGGEGGGRGVRAGEPCYVMARVDELGNDGGADPAGRAGDEHAHEKPPGGWPSPALRLAESGPMSVSVIRITSDVSCCHHI
jgi:hypothetical protein